MRSSEVIISSNRNDMNSLPFLLVSEFAKARDKKWTQLARELVYGRNVTPSVRLAITVLNVAVQELPEREEKASALFLLGVLFDNGAAGIEASAGRAVELYERAIREGNHVNSILIPLGSLGR